MNFDKEREFHLEKVERTFKNIRWTIGSGLDAADRDIEKLEDYLLKLYENGYIDQNEYDDHSWKLYPYGSAMDKIRDILNRL